MSKISQNQIELIQKQWGDGIIKIGKNFLEKGNYKKEAEILIADLYGFEEGTVLFKPTKAADEQFRLTTESAVSYFVGGNPDYPEDRGFAINPWGKVRFENSGFILMEHYAVAMGNYFFTDYEGNETKVEYTFGYFISPNGTLKINLHHSSLPFGTNQN